MVIVKPQRCVHCGHIFMSFVGGFVWSAPFPQHCPKCRALGKEIPGKPKKSWIKNIVETLTKK